LIEIIPPYTETKTLLGFGEETFIHGRLSDSQDWFAETPIVLTLLDGKVELRTKMDIQLP
jgi:hypothetical protein